jgi:hypothetical protein
LDQAALPAAINGASKGAAVPVPSFPDSAVKPSASKQPIDALFRYQPIFKLPKPYIKCMDKVYEGFENFSFADLNYEIMQKDLAFLRSSAGTLQITPHDFEKVIDVFEKIVFLGESQSKDHLVSRFGDVAPPEYVERIPKQSLEYIYQKYWKDEREKRKRSFLRMFWEKADFDDNDPFSAFRKRQKEKMKLRKKTKYEIDSYIKMFDIRSNCMSVLSIL